MRRLIAGLLLFAATATAARPASLHDRVAVRESLWSVPPAHRSHWLRQRGLDVALPLLDHRPDSSTGLRLIGKWGRGPSLSVTGQDSLVFVALGSEVAVVAVSDPSVPRILSEIQLNYLPQRVRVSGDLLAVGGAAVELWDVGAPAEPEFRSRLPLTADDFCLRDTFLYLISRDTFAAYSVADPTSPRRLGACRDSGYATALTGNTVVTVNSGGLGFVDVSDPALPHRVGSYPAYLWSAAAQGSLCCITVGNPNRPTWLQVQVIDITDPASAFRIGTLDSAGGYELVMQETLLLASGFYTGGHEFQVISLGDSTHPRQVGVCRTPGFNFGVCVGASVERAYVADRDMGLAVIDVTDLPTPTIDTTILRADMAVDISVGGSFAYVADYSGGLKVLDVASPAGPAEVGVLDSLAHVFFIKAVAVRDSFAFAGWDLALLNFRSVSITDPTHPSMGGGVGLFNWAEDIAVLDSFAYVAEASRFQILNVARPRQPVLVGSCVAGDLTRAGLVIRDTVAYFVGPFVGMQVFSVANPAAPRLLATVSDIRAMGCDVVDTLLYVGDYDDSLHIWNVANPAQPRQVSSVYATRCGYGVVVVGSYAYVGCDARIRVFDVADPLNPREVCSGTTPYEISRVVTDGRRVYSCCWDAGVCIFDTAVTGIGENGCAGPARPVSSATVTRGAVVLDVPDAGGEEVMLSAYDMAGQLVDCRVLKRQGAVVRYSFAHLPAGVYVLRLRAAERACTFRVVKL